MPKQHPPPPPPPLNSTIAGGSSGAVAESGSAFRDQHTTKMNNLREHLIYLSDEFADEDTMIQVVKMLEQCREKNDANNKSATPTVTGNSGFNDRSTDGGPCASSFPSGGPHQQQRQISPRVQNVPPLPLGTNIHHATAPTDDELLAHLGNPTANFMGMGSGTTPGQSPRDLLGGAGANNRSAGPLGDDSDDNEDYTPAAETPQMTPREGAARGGRRIGVSAAPMVLQAPSTFVPPSIKKSPEEAATLHNIVSGCHLFANMEEKERDVIVGALQRTSISAGAEVLRQGHIPEKPQFYLLFEGTCEVIKSGKHVASLAVGNTFGELEIMYDSECAATIRCVTPCVLYFLDRDSYRNIVYKVSVDKQKKYLKLIENVSFLDALSEYDKSTLAEALITSNYYLGDHIINFAERGTYMHIVVEGEVQVVGRERGKKVDVIKLGPGNVIGELEFLFDHLTIADVVAATKKVQTARISRKHFDMCVGITDELKAFVAKKGNYEHYLKEADDNVKKEIENLEKRVRKVEEDQNVTVENIDANGEIIMNQQVVDGNGNEKQVAFRYPLRPLSSSNLLMIGLSEAGTIVYWSDMVARLTNYTASEVIGQSLYTYIYNGAEQQRLHTSLVAANKHAGHVDEEYYNSTNSKLYTIQRSDGLTKTRMQLEIVPPCVAHGSGIAEVFLAIGHEVKSVPPTASNSSPSGWLTEQVRGVINDLEMDSDSKLAQIGSYVSKFEQIQRSAMNPSDNENLNVVNIRQLLGQVVMDYSQECIERNNIVTQNYDDLYQEDVYCDTTLLPQCLRYAMSNCARHLKDVTINVSVCVVEDFGVEQLKFTFTDSGPGFPKKVLDVFKRAPADLHHLSILQVKEAVEKQGGRMVIDSAPGKNSVSFHLPFIPDEGDAMENELSASATTSSMAIIRKETFTTLLVEDTPSHKNLICKSLWDRKHAVLPGYAWGDVQRFSDQTDILIVDMSQRAMSELATKSDPFSVLRDLSRTMSIILTGESIDDEMKNAANHAGFLTLRKPCTQIQAIQVLRKAEEKISAMRTDRQAIDATRAAFNENNRGEWTKGKILGKGAFGEVYEAVDVLTGGKMAVKYLKVPPDPNVRKEILNEIEVMCGLQHPNIIHYFFAEDDVENNIIKVVMEYAGGGTLQSLLADKGKLSPEEYVRYLRDVVEGVYYIHSEGYVHRDLKTPNVLLNADQVGKIGDFGTAKRIRKNKNDPDDQVEMMYEMTGTLSYMAPEVLSAGSPEDDDDENSKPVGYGFPADIWSLGCVALELATNKPPLHHLGVMTSMASITKFICGLRDVPDLSPLFDMPPAVIEFVSACMHPDPKKRPTAAQLREFSIFQDSGSEEMKSAMRALKRAQLMAVLNSFVAFQDPDEVKGKRKKTNTEAIRRKQEENFFGSSDDDDEDDDSDAPKGKPGADFFDSTDEEEEDSPDGEKQEDDFFADSDDEDDDDEEEGGNKDVASPPPASSQPEKVSAAPISAASPQKPLSESNDDEDDDTRRGSIKSAPAKSSNGGYPSPTIEAVGSQSSTTYPRNHRGGTATTTITVNRGSCDTDASSSTGGSGGAGGRHSNATTVGTIRSPRNGGEDEDTANNDQLVICLHDALLMLVDQIGMEANDALREQYNLQRAAFPVSPATSTRVEEVPQTSPADGVDSRPTITSPSHGKPHLASGSSAGVNNFKPNIQALLAADAELIKTVATLLRDKKSPST